MHSQALPRAPREIQQGLLKPRISDEAFRLECERVREELWVEVDDRRGDPNRSLETSGFQSAIFFHGTKITGLERFLMHLS